MSFHIEVGEHCDPSVLLSFNESFAIEELAKVFGFYQFVPPRQDDWRQFCNALGMTLSEPTRGKVALSQADIDRVEQQGEPMHTKLYFLVSLFKLRCDIFGVKVDLVRHFLDILTCKMVFHSPYQNLAETIIYRLAHSTD